MINIKEDSHVMAYDEYKWIENDSVVMFEGLFSASNIVYEDFFILSLVSMLANFWFFYS